MSANSPNSHSPSATSVFFNRLLTIRHLLTRRPVTLALTALVVILATGLIVKPFVGSQRAGSQPTTAPTEPRSEAALKTRALPVVTAKVSRAGPDFLRQQFTGIVSARRTTQLAAKTLGRVESLTVDIGDPVIAGQTLLQLDEQELLAQRAMVAASLNAAGAKLSELQKGARRQDIEQAQSRVQELRSLVSLQSANFDRTQSLRESAAISRQEFDESRFSTTAVQAQLAAAEQALELLIEGTRAEQIDAQAAVVEGFAAQLQTLDIQMSEKRIVAPYAGHIQARLVDEGAIVQPSQALLEIVETGALEVHVGLPPDLASRLTPDSLSVQIDGHRVMATIARISPSIQASTQTREVVLNLQSSDYERIAVGAAANVELKTRVDSQGFWIPTTALTASSRGLWAVYIASPTTALSPTAEIYVIERRQVELLRSQGEWSEVRGPIDEADELVMDGVHRVVPGQEVVLAQEAIQ